MWFPTSSAYHGGTYCCLVHIRYCQRFYKAINWIFRTKGHPIYPFWTYLVTQRAKRVFYTLTITFTQLISACEYMLTIAKEVLKWMQQFHLKATNRYCNETHIHLFPVFILMAFLWHKDTVSLVLAKFKQENIHSVWAKHLQGRKNMHYLRRKAGSVSLLRELHLEEFKRSACH